MGYVLLFGWPWWWPLEARQWFFHLAILGGLWDLKNHIPPSMDSIPSTPDLGGLSFRSVLIFDLFLKFVLCFSIAWWMFQPIFQHTYSSVPQVGIALVLMAFLGLFIWCYNERMKGDFPVSIFLLAHFLFICSLAILLALTGSLSTSQIVGILVACMGILFLLALFQKPIPQIVATVCLLEIFLCLYSYHYVEVKWWHLVLLSLSLLAPYGSNFFISSQKKSHIVPQLLLVFFISLLCMAPVFVFIV